MQTCYYIMRTPQIQIKVNGSLAYAIFLYKKWESERNAIVAYIIASGCVNILVFI